MNEVWFRCCVEWTRGSPCGAIRNELRRLEDVSQMGGDRLKRERENEISSDIAAAIGGRIVCGGWLGLFKSEFKFAQPTVRQGERGRNECAVRRALGKWFANDSQPMLYIRRSRILAPSRFSLVDSGSLLVNLHRRYARRLLECGINHGARGYITSAAIYFWPILFQMIPEDALLFTEKF